MAVGVMKGYIRSIKDGLDHHVGYRLPDSHPLLTWIARHAAHTYRLFNVGPDGRTPAARLSGVRSRPHCIAELGERVWWMPLQSQGGRGPLEARCEDGFYVGRNGTSNESLIITETGVVRARTFWKRPLSERWSPDLYKCSASVIQPSSVDPSVTTIGIKAPIWMPDDPNQATRLDPVDPLPRHARRLQLAKGTLSDQT